MSSREEIFKMIKEAKTLDAINILCSLNLNGETEKTTLLLSSRYSQNKSDFNSGTIGTEKYKRELSKINSAIIDLADIIFRPEDNNSIRNNDKFVSLFDVFLKNLPESPGIKIKYLGIEQSIYQHSEEVINWAKFISFKEISKRKSLNDIYIDLDFYLTPRSNQLIKNNNPKTINVNEIFDLESSNIIILGQPGAGKTTTTKKIALEVYEDNSTLSKKFQFPIVLRFREFNNLDLTQVDIETLLYLQILNILGIWIHVHPLKETKNGIDKKINSFSSYFRSGLSRSTITLLNALNVLLILEGFDELNSNLQQKILPQIDKISANLTNSKLILTTRTGDFYFNIENTVEYEIKSLTDDQIKKFVSQWFIDYLKAENLFNKIVKSPFYDTMIRPLTLAHLCAIYERYSDIPEKPKTIYRKIVNLLLEEWDNQRSIKRISKYSHFDIDRKFEFLCSVSFILTTKYKTTVFSERILQEVYGKIYQDFGLPIEECYNVMKEIETHNGLILKTGYSTFEFAHKSIQEYLTAEYIVKLPNLLGKYFLKTYPNELALTIAISSNPTLYFTTLIFHFFDKDITPNFVESFFERIFVEKPDFSINTLLGIGFLKLFTLCNISSKSEIVAEAQFLKFGNVESIANSVKEAVKFYIIKGETESGLMKLENSKTYYDEDFFITGGYSMPTILFYHKKFGMI